MCPFFMSIMVKKSTLEKFSDTELKKYIVPILFYFVIEKTKG
ncbi:hypothetical protein VO54_00298 [Elizabethkingia miricola]|nr:hypothetical protein VO54_00298 [Elizabethkingia miricola]